MTEQERASELIARLHQAYPDAKCSLDFTTPLELLIATILSAQCTDERVNMVTKTLFKKYRTAQDYAAAPLAQLEQDLKQVNFYRNKAKNIQATAAILVQRYDGQVPHTMQELIALPGVARKTANVVLSNALGQVEGIIVDTHVRRLSQRLGLTSSEDPLKIEQELMKKLPRQDWLAITHLLIYHGRAVCQARKPLCQQCVLIDLCPTGSGYVVGAGARATNGSENAGTQFPQAPAAGGAGARAAAKASGSPEP
ncbi:MAG TPA: endonuclease III [Ktedonobacterales bacterium]|jgi:endonuclease-3